MTMSSGLYGFASLKGEVGLEAGGSWFVLEGKSILTYRESGGGGRYGWRQQNMVHFDLPHR